MGIPFWFPFQRLWKIERCTCTNHHVDVELRTSCAHTQEFLITMFHPH
jgi:hypothetical protein